MWTYLVTDLARPPSLVAGYLGVLGEHLHDLALPERQLVLALGIVVVERRPEVGGERVRRRPGVHSLSLADVNRADHVSIAGRFHGPQLEVLHQRRHPLSSSSLQNAKQNGYRR